MKLWAWLGTEGVAWAWGILGGQCRKLANGLLAEPGALGPQPARAKVRPVPLAPTILKSNSLVPASQQVKAGDTDTPDITIEPESLENEHLPLTATNCIQGQQ